MSGDFEPGLVSLAAGNLLYLALSAFLVMFLGGIEPLLRAGEFTRVVSYAILAWLFLGAVIGIADIVTIARLVGGVGSGFGGR